MRLHQILYILLSFGFFATQSCSDFKQRTKPINVKNDSIPFWMEALDNDSYSVDKRKQFLVNAYKNFHASKSDSIDVKNLSALAYQSYKLGDTLLFKKINSEALKTAQKLCDSFAIGDAHWNYASYYNKEEVYDSAYYHFNVAHTYFERGGYLFEAATTQYGMAFIKGRFRDYSGSEDLIFKAVSKFEKLKVYNSLYSCYDLLGQLQNDIKEYDQALVYYTKSTEYSNKTEDNGYLYDASLNNIGNTYLKKGDYSTALNYFNKVLKNENVKSKNIGHYARVLSNKGYCKLLMKDTTNVLGYLQESLRIRDSLGNKSGVIISKIYLSNYYGLKKDTIKSIKFAKEANSLAKEIGNNGNYLETLWLLATLEPNNSQEYLKRYIQFSDSLQTVERRIQNKFTRISYETDGYIEKTKRLSQQKIWILIVSIGVISILGLLYFLLSQKSKNEKLKLENEQQKANEQIYLITFKQQEKLEKEKIRERNRIAEELHDGILGKLFGTRVGLGFLDISDDKNIRVKHRLYLEELQNIEKEIRDVSHKLSDNFDSTAISFTTIIKQLIINKSKIGNFKYHLSFDQESTWQNIDEIIKVNLYRIIQEALQNSIKYASAKNISVLFLMDGEKMKIQIKDDGVGFDIKQRKSGIGIKNMKSRVKKLKGAIWIHSIPNVGTTIKIKIPI